VTQTLPRHRQHQADVTPAGLENREHGGHVGAVLDGPVAAIDAADAPGTASTRRAGIAHAVVQSRKHVEFLRILVLGEVVLARVGTEDLDRNLMCLIDDRLELRRNIQIDTHTNTAPSMRPTARRSRYHRSTGCSLTKPCPPSNCTPLLP